jgi:hypothetical protein
MDWRSRMKHRKTFRLLLGFSIMFVVLSAGALTVDAESIAITRFFGEWRATFVSCVEAKGNPALEFYHNESGDFAVFGVIKCKVNYKKHLAFVVANPRKCIQSGFPSEFVGKYSLIIAGEDTVDGHLQVIGTNGRSSLLLDCYKHQPL